MKASAPGYLWSKEKKVEHFQFLNSFDDIAPVPHIAYVRGATNDTTDMPMPSRVLSFVPLVAPMVSLVPILPTIGCRFCRHPRAWAKLPARENDVIPDGVESR